jgi:hypothetical protein
MGDALPWGVYKIDWERLFVLKTLNGGVGFINRSTMRLYVHLTTPPRHAKARELKVNLVRACGTRRYLKSFNEDELTMKVCQVPNSDLRQIILEAAVQDVETFFMRKRRSMTCSAQVFHSRTQDPLCSNDQTNSLMITRKHLG